MRFVLMVLLWCCTVYAKLDHKISGVLRVHMYPVCPVETHALTGVGHAFLVDKKEGLFVAINPKGVDPFCALVPFVRLEAIDGRVLRCHPIQHMHQLNLLKVYEEDKPLLQDLHEFRVSSNAPPLNAEVSLVSDWSTKVWADSTLSSTWTYDKRHSVMYEVGAPERIFVSGGPLLLKETGDVVGVVMHRFLSTLCVFSGEYLAFQLNHFNRYKTLFTPHLGVAFRKETLSKIETEFGHAFKPKGYECSKLPNTRLMMVGCVWVEDGRLMSPSLRVGDVFLAIDGAPVYRERDIWEALRAAHHKGQASVKVRLWRYGSVREESVELRFFTSTMPKRVHRYGPCFFVEGGVFQDAQKQLLQISCQGLHPLERCELQKIDGRDVKTIDDVIAVLRDKDQEGLWMQVKTLTHTLDGGCIKEKREKMYFLWPTQTPRLSATYVFDGSWSKQC